MAVAAAASAVVARRRARKVSGHKTVAAPTSAKGRDGGSIVHLHKIPHAFNEIVKNNARIYLAHDAKSGCAGAFTPPPSNGNSHMRTWGSLI